MSPETSAPRRADEPLVELEGVGCRLDGVQALDAVDLVLKGGELVAVIGANGSGKTTLLRLVGGTLAPTRGRVTVLGSDPHRSGRRLRRRLGFVPQESALDPEMTGREMLALFCTLHGVPRASRRQRVADLLRAFGLEAQADRLARTWSGGERRRLHLALGLVHDPEVLLLDEPTAGLDPPGRAALWSELERRAEAGAAVATVTHDLDRAGRHATRVAVLEAGRLLAVASPAELGAQAPGGGLAAAYARWTGRDADALRPDARGDEPGGRAGPSAS